MKKRTRKFQRHSRLTRTFSTTRTVWKKSKTRPKHWVKQGPPGHHVSHPISLPLSQDPKKKSVKPTSEAGWGSSSSSSSSILALGSGRDHSFPFFSFLTPATQACRANCSGRRSIYHVLQVENWTRDPSRLPATKGNFLLLFLDARKNRKFFFGRDQLLLYKHKASEEAFIQFFKVRSFIVVFVRACFIRCIHEPFSFLHRYVKYEWGNQLNVNFLR